MARLRPHGGGAHVCAARDCKMWQPVCRTGCELKAMQHVGRSGCYRSPPSRSRAEAKGGGAPGGGQRRVSARGKGAEGRQGPSAARVKRKDRCLYNEGLLYCPLLLHAVDGIAPFRQQHVFCMVLLLFLSVFPCPQRKFCGGTTVPPFTFRTGHRRASLLCRIFS